MGVKNFSEFNSNLDESDFKQYFWDLIDDGFSIKVNVGSKGSRIVSENGDVLDCYVVHIVPQAGYDGNLENDISRIEKIAKQIESSEGIQFARYDKPYKITVGHVLFFKIGIFDLSRFYRKNFDVQKYEKDSKIFFYKEIDSRKKSTGILYYDLSSKILIIRHSLVHSLEYSFLIGYTDCYIAIRNQVQKFLGIDPKTIQSSNNLSEWKNTIDNIK